MFGVSLLQQQAELPSISWAWGLIPILAASGWLARYSSGAVITLRRILLCLLCLGIGFFWAAALAQWRLSDFLPQSWERKDIQITGVVASVQQNNDRGIRFRFDVEHVITPGAAVPQHLLLSWFKERQTGMRHLEKHRDLLAVCHGDKRGAQRHFGFAEADIAANQAIHRFAGS